MVLPQIIGEEGIISSDRCTISIRRDAYNRLVADDHLRVVSVYRKTGPRQYVGANTSSLGEIYRVEFKSTDNIVVLQRIFIGIPE